MGLHGGKLWSATGGWGRGRRLVCGLQPAALQLYLWLRHKQKQFEWKVRHCGVEPYSQRRAERGSPLPSASACRNASERDRVSEYCRCPGAPERLSVCITCCCRTADSHFLSCRAWPSLYTLEMMLSSLLTLDKPQLSTGLEAQWFINSSCVFV